MKFKLSVLLAEGDWDQGEIRVLYPGALAPVEFTEYAFVTSTRCSTVRSSRREANAITTFARVVEPLRCGEEGYG
jgi:hypothetical protein